MNYMQQLANILRSNYRLIAMPTTRAQTVITLMDEFCRKVNHPAYLWHKGSGLQGLGEQYAIADTTNPLDVIDFIRSASHPGIYLLLDFPITRGSRLSIEIKRLLTKQPIKSRIILLGANINIDQALMPLTLTVECCHSNETPQNNAFPVNAKVASAPGSSPAARH